jgi:hypothetical protein
MGRVAPPDVDRATHHRVACELSRTAAIGARLTIRTSRDARGYRSLSGVELPARQPLSLLSQPAAASV